LLALMLATGVAQAADAPAAAATTVQEIVVTADKRPELAKNVPASITAVPASTLRDIGAANLDDYVQLVPGLTVSNVSMATGSTQLTIRGVTTGPGGNPTVGVYVDDAPFGTSTGLGGYTIPDLDPQDLARVEVLRGPQGTLYGAGAMGGLLKYVTADPDPTHVFGRLEADYSSTDHGGDGWGVRGGVNLPLGDSLALRLSGYDRQDPGYVDNVLTGQNNVNRTDVYGGRAALGWAIDQDWKARLSAIYQSQKGAGPLVEYGSITFKPLYGDLKESDAIDSDIDRQKLQAYSLDIEGKLGSFASFTSSTAYDRQDMNLAVDYTPLVTGLIAGVFGVPNAGLSVVDDVGVDKFTQEFRLASPEDNKLSWLVGAYYTHEQTSVAFASPVFNEFTGAPITGLPTFLSGGLSAKFQEEAVFGDVTYHFTPAFDVTAGLRYSHNDQRDVTVTGGILTAPSNANVTSSDSSTTFLLTPRWHVNEDTMVYARIATGYRPGGPNTGIGGTPLTYGPDHTTNYEIGVKTDLDDHRISLDADAYWIDWKNIQVEEASAFGSYIANGSAAVSRGVEGSVEWRPTAPLTLFANLAYQDAYVTEAFPAGGAAAQPGDRLPLTPTWSGTVGGEYVFPLFASWNGRIGADWHYVGRTEGSFPNPGAPRFEHPAYDVADLHAGVSNDQWRLMLYAKNIGDARGQTADLNLGAFTRVSIIQPRTVGLSLSRTF
jgi:outer membrane receptor protein involved in Fe transport